MRPDKYGEKVWLGASLREHETWHLCELRASWAAYLEGRHPGSEEQKATQEAIAEIDALLAERHAAVMARLEREAANPRFKG